MFDIGWQELFVITAVGIVVIGPKDLPRVLAQTMKYVRKARSIAREFQSSIDDVVRQAEVEDIRREVEKASEFDLENEIRNTIDPTGDITRELDLSGETSDLEKTAASKADSGDEPAVASGKDEGAAASDSASTESESPPTESGDAPTESRPDDPAKPASG